MSIELGMPEVPRFTVYSGRALDALSWQMERSGLLGAKAMLLAQGEAIAGTAAVGAPTALVMKRFGKTNHQQKAVDRDIYGEGKHLGRTVHHTAMQIGLWRKGNRMNHRIQPTPNPGDLGKGRLQLPGHGHI
jgi:hypothetical protein